MAAAIWVEAAAAVDNPRKVDFWQVFLAANLSPNDRATFLSGLPEGIDPVAALYAWPKLRPEQRERMRLAQSAPLPSLVSKGVHVLTGHGLPGNLATVPNPPAALFAWGDPSVLDKPCVGIVGTRKASSYGMACARKFAEALDKAGITVISGGAQGIDASAHRGALDYGSTVAVLGTGVDGCFPSSHRGLYDEIKDKGCLISQFACGTPSFPENFIHRNTVIAALSMALILIEGPPKSGALMTANATLDMGRELFVVPGPIHLTSFQGSHALIREGATLVDHPSLVLEALGIEPLSEVPQEEDYDPMTSAILEVLGAEPLSGDHVV
ncbi:MAG: DNA-processing protein DprA, partial [Armatimonadota bacterium]